jgi:hypothetical protein
VPSLNTSFWTYKFLTDCSMDARGISGIGIPICEEINAANITVEEKIDGCGLFQPVPFELRYVDPNFGPAPAGTRFLKIESGGRYDKGVCVMYRVGIIGDYPEAVQQISVKAADFLYLFGCLLSCYVVPGCNPGGKLLVSKTCGSVIVNNQAALQYSVNVDNIGTELLSPVFYEDTIVIPLQLTIGTVSVSPATLDVNTSVPGQVSISGELGAIAPGGRVSVTYSLPVTNVSAPGSYIIANMARANATGTESVSACTTRLDAVRLSALKCCAVDGSTGTFTIVIAGVGASPDVIVDIADEMTVPPGVTVLFSGFNGCEAYYAGTATPIPLFENLTGPLAIDIFCRNALVPAGGSYIKTLSYTLVSSSVVGTASITNTVTAVTPQNLGMIIYEGTDNLPAEAGIDVELAQACTTPC